MRLSPLAAVLILSPACSFWAVRGPNEFHGGGDCTISAAAPVLDGVFAASLVGLGVAGLTAHGCPGPGLACLGVVDASTATHGVGAGLLAVAAVETAAAIYGGAKLQQCREARKDLVMPATVPVQPPEVLADFEAMPAQPALQLVEAKATAR